MQNEYLENSLIGNLLFIKEVDKIRKRRGGLFKCHCGKQFETPISDVKSGNTKSCGCERVKNITKHGASKENPPEYEAWNAMKKRCKGYNEKNKKIYKDKGITVCDRWLEPKGQGFINFLEDMGEKPTKKHSLDRVDGTKSYSPENCRWATIEEQNNNLSSNLLIEFNGKIQTATQWAKELNINKNKFLLRYHIKGNVQEVIDFDPEEHTKIYEYKGNMYSLTGLAKLKGMNRTGFSDRLKKMTIEEAMEKPFKSNISS